jgi:hypothetical protein
MFRFELKRCMKGRGFKAAFLISLILAAGHFTAFCICFLHNEYGGIITDKEAVKLLKVRVCLEYILQIFLRDL